MARPNAAPQRMVHASCSGSEVRLFIRHTPFQALLQAATGATVLYHDATFNDSDKDRAKATHHSTTVEAGRLARQAGVGTLVIGHVSLRYRDLEALRAEASTEHDKVIVAEDGMIIHVGS